jgi:oligopeptide transport system substrate-binding protein
MPYSFPGVRQLGLVVSLVLLTAGCSRREPAIETGLRTQTLHLGNLSEPSDLDPHVITSLQDFNILLALMEGLTGYDPATSEPVPGAAERWEASEDQRTWTFHLRPGARWSNGEPVTAHDFVSAFSRILSPSLGAEYGYMLYSLENAERYAAGELTDFSAVGAKAIDDRTLQLNLAYPVPYLPSIVAHSSWFPVHRPTLEKFGRFEQRGSAWTRPGNFVGNGPFNLAEWKPNQVLRVTRSETYWDAANVRLQAVNFFPIESTASEEAAFRSGQLHATTGLPIDKISVYRNDPKLQPFLRQQVYLATYFYRFNVRRPPLDDVRVRRALAFAIERERLIDRVTLGGQVPAYGLTPPDTAGYNAGRLFEANVEEARRLLAEAGYPDGRGFPALELLFNTNEGHRRIAEAIQQMWKRNLNIDIRLYNQEAKVQSDSMRQGEYSIARYAWVGDYLDPSTFLELMTSSSGNNQTGWSNAEYDRLVEAARHAADTTERYDLFRQAEALLIADMPIASIYFYTQNNLLHPMVKGWHGNLLSIHPLHRVSLAE